MNSARSQFNARLAQIARVRSEHPSIEADVRLLALTGPSTSVDGEVRPMLADHPCADRNPVLQRIDALFDERE